MKTNIIVNVSIVVPVNCGKEAVSRVKKSFIEKLARDIVVDAIHAADKDMEIKRINVIG